MTAPAHRVFFRVRMDDARKLTQPVTWSFNLPDHDGYLEIVRPRVGQTYHGQCFRQRGEQVFHDLRWLDIDPTPDSDQTVVMAGHVSATLIDSGEMGWRVLPESSRPLALSERCSRQRAGRVMYRHDFSSRLRRQGWLATVWFRAKPFWRAVKGLGVDRFGWGPGS